MENNRPKTNAAGLVLSFFLQLLCALIGAASVFALCAWTTFSYYFEVASVTDPYITRYAMLHVDSGMAALTDRLAVAGFAGAALAVVIGVLLIFLAGRNVRTEEGGVYLCWCDRIWTELHLAFIAIACVGAAGTVVTLPRLLAAEDFLHTGMYVPMAEISELVSGMSNLVFFGLLFAAATLFIWLGGMAFLSVVRKLKASSFFSTALIGRLFIALYGFFARAGESLYSAFSPKTAAKIRNLREGMAHIRAGELTYKIPVETGNKGLKRDLDNIAAAVNDISSAADRAVQNELKNTRMKTELISNVSHDIKTPLTSIITYVDLLKKADPGSPEAAQYIDIIDQKAQRLKQLTENLFDAAKAASGNMPCRIESINLAELVSQAIGETDEKLQAKGLQVIVTNKAENSMVKADGQLLWRVIDNLLSNICKYALQGSRVYIDIAQVNTSKGRPYVGLQVKNISRDPLNISAEELMERFTRGDESRNTEGSGLGLAIARDLTQLMHGSFDVSVDGDLFKALLVLEQA
ncbi:MAG: HAMP domain-containing histidine kinase [Firmicutes bacterium]|nr:HAMP domain-containing histidine kinase [Bacillota bacterium]